MRVRRRTLREGADPLGHDGRSGDCGRGLGELADPRASLDLGPPLVTVIGDVVTLRAQLRWFDKAPAREGAPARGYEDGPDFLQTADHTQPVTSSASPTSSGVQ